MSVEVELSEVPDVIEKMREVIRALDYPAYKVGVYDDEGGASPIVVGPSYPIDRVASAVGIDTDPDDESLPEVFTYPPIGALVEINGFDFVVYSADLDGRVTLVRRDDLDDDFLAPPEGCQ